LRQLRPVVLTAGPRCSDAGWPRGLDLLLMLVSLPLLWPLVSDDDQGLWVSHREPVTPSSAGSDCRSPTRRARSARCYPWPPPARCTAASRAACSGRPGLCLGVALVAMAPPLALKCPRLHGLLIQVGQVCALVWHRWPWRRR
jgi:hypothetical protein